MRFYEWTDFVTYPLDPFRVNTRAERLDTSRAFRVGENGQMPSDYSPGGEHGAVIDRRSVIWDDDVFECMEIDDDGQVTIWTRDKVWCLFRKLGRMEKLIYLPRHPSE